MTFEQLISQMKSFPPRLEIDVDAYVELRHYIMPKSIGIMNEIMYEINLHNLTEFSKRTFNAKDIVTY